MRLLDVVESPWAIVPSKLQEIKSIYETHLRGEKIDLKGVEERVGPLNNMPVNVEVYNGVGVVHIEGVIAKRMNLFTKISGGTSTQLAAKDFLSVLNDPSIHTIVLALDSPGGTVDGTEELARLIYANRGSKQIIAHADGMMCSGAYWIGAAADMILLSGETTAVGSIGVVGAHVDISKQEAKEGVKTTEITAGKYKRIDSVYEPLTEEGRAYMQAEIDYIYGIFVGDVAKMRGESVEYVLENMADGRVFMGQQAIDAGLADGFMPLSMLVETCAGGVKYSRGRVRAVKRDQSAVDADDPIIQGGSEMTVEEMREKHADIVNLIEVSAREEAFSSGMKEGAMAGAIAERERIKAVESKAVIGQEALMTELKFDGKTTGPEAAEKMLAAVVAAGGVRHAQMIEDAPEAVPSPSVPAIESVEEGDGEEKLNAAAAKYAEEHSVSLREAYRAVALENPALTSYRKKFKR